MLFIVPLIVGGSISAQVVKCKDESGKVTYTHGSKCPVGFATPVNLSGGNISPLSQEELDRDHAKWEANQLVNPPIECRFAHWKARGQSAEYSSELSTAATRECLSNIKAAKEGRPQSFLALDRYKAVFEPPQNNRSTIIYQRNSPVMQLPRIGGN